MATQHAKWILHDTTGSRNAEYVVCIHETGVATYSVTIEFGRIGSALQMRRKQHAVALGIAEAAAQELVNKKLAANYVQQSYIRRQANTAAPAARPPKRRVPAKPGRTRVTIKPINWTTAPIVF
ncbi:MAG: WGR domain-containing protein [Pseudomonas sp.]